MEKNVLVETCSILHYRNAGLINFFFFLSRFYEEMHEIDTTTVSWRMWRIFHYKTSNLI